MEVRSGLAPCFRRHGFPQETGGSAVRKIVEEDGEEVGP